jgi:hypothetical protein
MSVDPSTVSPLKRREIVDALRSGAVPKRGLELFAVGLGDFEKAIDAELASVAAGGGRIKAVRGEYGSGKTFFARWLEHRARQQGFATALVQISESSPLYRMETIYRRAIEVAADQGVGRRRVPLAGRAVVLRARGRGPRRRALCRRAMMLRSPSGRRAAREEARGRERDPAAIRGGAASLPRSAASPVSTPSSTVSDRVAHGAAERRRFDQAGSGPEGRDRSRWGARLLRGLLELLRQTGRKGLVLVLDEVETIQRVRADSREKSLNALRQMIRRPLRRAVPGPLRAGHRNAAVLRRTAGNAAGRGAGAAAARGLREGPTLRQRARGAAPARAVRSRRGSSRSEDRSATSIPRGSRAGHAKVGDEVLGRLADGVAGKLGGNVGLAPRIYLRSSWWTCSTAWTSTPSTTRSSTTTWWSMRPR